MKQLTNEIKKWLQEDRYFALWECLQKAPEFWWYSPEDIHRLAYPYYLVNLYRGPRCIQAQGAPTLDAMRAQIATRIQAAIKVDLRSYIIGRAAQWCSEEDLSEVPKECSDKYCDKLFRFFVDNPRVLVLPRKEFRERLGQMGRHAYATF